MHISMSASDTVEDRTILRYGLSAASRSQGLSTGDNTPIVYQTSPLPISNESSMDIMTDDDEVIWDSNDEHDSHLYHDRINNELNEEHGTGQRYEQTMSEREWTRMEQLYHNNGYREGLEVGKEHTLQQGFDQGYQEGLALGRELGLLRGNLASIIAAHQLGHLNANTLLDEQLVNRAINFEKSLSPAMLASSMAGWMSIGTVEEITTACSKESSNSSCYKPNNETDTASQSTTSNSGCCKSKSPVSIDTDVIATYKQKAMQLQQDGFPLVL